MLSLTAIGTIATPYQTLEECPRNIDADGPSCRITLKPEFAPQLTGLEQGQSVLLLYWLDPGQHQAVDFSQTPAAKGTFALRTPVRPNPIGAAVVEIAEITPNGIQVLGLDCLNGTFLLDIKPAIMRELS